MNDAAVVIQTIMVLGGFNIRERMKLASDSDDPSILAYLSQDTNWMVRIAVAENLSVPASALAKLCTDDMLDIRQAAITNPNLSPEGMQAAIQASWPGHAPRDLVDPMDTAMIAILFHLDCPLSIVDQIEKMRWIPRASGMATGIKVGIRRMANDS